MFRDRKEAGEKLALKLKNYKGQDAIVYALPRGGVVVADEIAKALDCPLDILVSRKIGHPFSPEYAIGAIAPDGHSIFNENEKREIKPNELEKIINKEMTEAKRRDTAYLGKRGHIGAQNKIAIIVDDGIATGLTMKLAVKEIKHQNPKKIIVAIPVLPKDTALELQKEADEVISVLEDENYLGAVGSYYEYFPQVEDNEVIKIMEKYKQT